MSKLKFNRYWICDRSGHGKGKWQYFTGDFEGDRSYAKTHVLETLESWALYAESYSMDIELDVEPTIEFLERELKVYDDLALYYTRSADELRRLLNPIN